MFNLVTSLSTHAYERTNEWANEKRNLDKKCVDVDQEKLRKTNTCSEKNVGLDVLLISIT